MGIFSKKNQDDIPDVPDNYNNNGQATRNVILDSIRDSVIIVGGDKNISYMNPAAASLVDYSKDQAVGLHYSTVIRLVDQDGEALQEDRDPIAAAFKTNQYIETRDFGVAKVNAKGTVPIHLAITSVVTNNQDSKVVIMRNISQELKEEQERSEFISTASHEMRTPVASIEGYLGLALSPQTATIDDRARAYLSKAHEASQHLGELFRNLLDTSRLDDNKIKTYFVPVEMTSLIKDIADGMAPNIAAKGLEYQFGKSDPGAVEISSARKLDQLLYCSLDINYLREIIDNIIQNAIKYTPSGSIVVSVQGDPDEAIVVVADTGIGISREHQKHIFQKFYRVDNSETRSTEGTGLGLYIVKQRTEAMHGRVWVESEEGKGAKFFVAFPRISSEDYERQKLAATSTMQPTAPVASPPAEAPVAALAQAPATAAPTPPDVQASG